LRVLPPFAAIVDRVDVIHSLIEQSLPIAWVALVVAFAVLAKCADVFVDNAVALANALKIPKLIIGIVLVSLATTAPELAVSLTSALRGNPEMALGNAVGSVICNGGLALALSGIVSVAIIAVMPRVLNTAGTCLVTVAILAFVFVFPDSTLSRWEGAVLVVVFFAYTAYLLWRHRKDKDPAEEGDKAARNERRRPLWLILLFFVVALAGIIIASNVIISSASTIARSFGIPEGMIALTLVALGTSIPEVATCVAAALKKQGSIAVGNILGANIMNICWVAGASAIANDLTLSRQQILFMFPWMFVIVAAMLILLRIGHNLGRRKGLILLALYAIYIATFFVLFRPMG